MHVTHADTSGKADASPISKLASLSSELASSSSELYRVQRLHVTSAEKSGKEDWPMVSEQAHLLRKLTLPRFLNWPLRFLSSPLRSLKSRRVLIFIEARNSFQSTLEFLPVETPSIALLRSRFFQPLLSSTHLKMSGPSDHRFDLNLGEEASMPSPDNIWRPSFISPTGPLTVGDSMMKNDMTAAMVAWNLVTPKDNRLLSKRSDELDVKDSLALIVQCAGSV
ncbi:hypothetical protein ACFX12_009290 [Malus domestica]